MDKNTFIGLGLLAVALVLLFTRPASQSSGTHEQSPGEHSTGQSQASSTTPALIGSNAEPPLLIEPTETSILSNESEESIIIETEVEEAVLENDYIAVTFTTRGGAIKEVAFKNYAAQLQTRGTPITDPYRFNARSTIPALSLHIPDAAGKLRVHEAHYRLQSLDKEAIRFELELAPGIRVQREYRLSHNPSEEPYVIQHATRFINDSGTAFSLNKLYFNVGTARPSKADPYGQSINFGYYDGEDSDFIPLSRFEANDGYLGIGLFSRSARPPLTEAVEPILWASIKNQFFTGIITPEEPGVGIHVRAIPLLANGEDTALEDGITGSLAFALGALDPGKERQLKLDYYVGPKEFQRLQKFAQSQDKVMQFPPFIGFLSKALLSFMILLHSFVPNWGWAIILLTVCIKLLFWPLTAQAARSQKRMQRIQQPLKELRERYKDNPKKLQTEMLKLFKLNKVNPASGCLPILIQMPIFIALFYTLRSASELRYAEFIFWIKDLSQPDTVGEIFGLPINILPLIMGLTMFLQMHMMPSTAAADSMQQKVLKFMPIIFLVICYNFSSGLVLYWTVQNLLTILQQSLTNRQKDPEPTVEVIPPSSKKGKKRRALPSQR